MHFFVVTKLISFHYFKLQRAANGVRGRALANARRRAEEATKSAREKLKIFEAERGALAKAKIDVIAPPSVVMTIAFGALGHASVTAAFFVARES